MKKAILIIAFLFFLPIKIDGSSECINLNTATKEELVRIIHIGDSRAEQIMSLRPFSSMEELERIAGIGPTLLNEIKEQGLACVNQRLGRLEEPEKEAPQEYPSPEKESSQDFKNRAFAFFIALGLAGFSGGMVLALKKSVKIS